MAELVEATMPHMYILECADGTYYTGSTVDLKERFWQHQDGVGANYTSKRIPVKLVYCEKFDQIEDAFRREKQVQGWSHAKKQALIEKNPNSLLDLSRNYTVYGRPTVISTDSTLRQAQCIANSPQANSMTEPSAISDHQTPVVEPVETTSEEST